LTRQQIYKILGLKVAGKKVSYFQRIEEVTLESSTRRDIKQAFRKERYNALTSEICLGRVSGKKSRKEWVLGEENKENEYIIGRVQKKRKVYSEIVPWHRFNKEALNSTPTQDSGLM